MKKSITNFIVLVIAAFAFIFIGCGGGGGGGDGGTSGGEENKSPVAITGPNQTVDEGTFVSLDASNSNDPDDGIASYLWEQTEGPLVTLSNPSSVKPTFTAPSVGAGGAALTFRLTVTDKGGLKSTAICIVNVTATNIPPIAEAGSDQTVDEGTLVTLDGSGSTDPDDGITSYLWEQTGGPFVSLSDYGAVKPTFISPSVGSSAALTFRLTVTDNGGLKSSDTCIVNVTYVNKPPVAEAGPYQTAYVGVLVMLDGSVSADPDNDDISYQWQQTGGPAVTLTNANTALAQFTASVAAGSVLSFRLTVTDIWGLQSTDTTTVTVQENPKKLAQTVLYTAYAGIGYGRANYTATDDDEFLYNVMLDDLNTVTGNLVMDTIFYDTNVLTKLINLALGITTTFNYTYPSGVAGSIKVNPGAFVNGYRSFTADLSVNFNATAYLWEACNYYGPDGGEDLTAHITGYYKATTEGLEELFMSTVRINPQPSLKAVYPKTEVRYSNWIINYQTYYGDADPTYTTGMSTTPVNMKVVPTLITEPSSDADFREYDMSGGFSLNGNTYTFGTSSVPVKYNQEQGNGLTFIYISGNLITPDLTDPVTVSIPAANPVIRNIYGFWISGQMNFAGLSGTSQAVFNSNYSCTFSGGNQDPWTVTGWQNTLEP